MSNSDAVTAQAPAHSTPREIRSQGAPVSPAVATHAAASAKSFLDSLGVVTHIDSGWAQWTNAPVLLNALSYLGISNLRDGAPFDYALPTFITLARAGIRFSILEANVYSFDQTGQVNATLDVSRAHALEAAVPGSIFAFEGTNEYTTNHYTLNGASSWGDLAWGLQDAAALKTAVRADPLFATTPIIAPSAIQLDSLPDFSSFVNGANAHIYGNVGEQLQDRIVNSIRFAQASAPGQPVYITETGISSAGYGSSTWGVTDEDTQAVININALLDGFAAGAEMTFLYELLDEPGASNIQEQHFGLFRADGTPKPAATAIGNLTHLLADEGGVGAPPTSLEYDLSGLPATASSLLLAKSDGTFDLVIWNGRATLYDGVQEITPPTANLTLTLGRTATSVAVFDPVLTSSPRTSLVNADSVALQLSANPIVVEMRFGAPQSSPQAPLATNLTWLSGTAAVLSGTAEAGSIVSVYEGSVLLGTAGADPDGEWTLRLPASSAAKHSLTITALDRDGTAVSSAGLTLYGNPKQTLIGGDGDDVLFGAPNDRLIGGAGDDRFVINKSPGKQTIVDFDSGAAAASGDQLFIDSQLAANFADLMSRAKQTGTGTVISFTKSHVITLEHVSPSELQASDFIFF
jgi:hypothetical protein